MSDTPPDIVIALDDGLVAAGLAALLASVGLAEVIAPDLATLIEVLVRSTPAAVFVGSSLGGSSLLGRMPQLAGRFPASRIVVCLRGPDPAIEDFVRLAGGTAVFCYRMPGPEVVARTVALLAGDGWNDTDGAGDANDDHKPDDVGIYPSAPLSELQWRLVELFAKGNTVVAVAERLHRSAKAIEYNRHEIRRKVGVAAPHPIDWGRLRRYPKQG